MPRKGWKCLNLTEDQYKKIELIAKMKKMSRKAVVLDALEDKYPSIFPKEIFA